MGRARRHSPPLMHRIPLVTIGCPHLPLNSSGARQKMMGEATGRLERRRRRVESGAVARRRRGLKASRGSSLKHGSVKHHYYVIADAQRRHQSGVAARVVLNWGPMKHRIGCRLSLFSLFCSSRRHIYVMHVCCIAYSTVIVVTVKRKSSCNSPCVASRRSELRSP